MRGGAFLFSSFFSFFDVPYDILEGNEPLETHSRKRQGRNVYAQEKSDVSIYYPDLFCLLRTASNSVRIVRILGNETAISSPITLINTDH